MAPAIIDYLRSAERGFDVRDLATISPLLAAIFAPISTLFDIPALSETWYAKNGVPQPDPAASLILSGVGLAFNFIANALLIFRFSTVDDRWKMAVNLSIVFWAVKVGVGLANLITFGILTRNKPEFAFNEGFWCAVVSAIISGLILLLLVVHWWYDVRKRSGARKLNQDVRISGRHFMLQTTAFIALIAIAALVFSRLERWTYLQGIYFTVVAFLTVGFGDFEPTKTSSRILLFPFALLGIALLGSLLEMIVRFFSDRAAERKLRARALWEERRRAEVRDAHGLTNLADEIAELERLNSRQDAADQFVGLVVSLAGFLTFWFVGAVIFWSIEGWAYGSSLYFCYIFFLSIGYGDFAPRTPGGRVVFIIYSLLAVPVMASFAVQAVTSLMTKFSSYRLDERKAKYGIDQMSTKNEEKVISHAEFVERFHAHWEERNVPEKSSALDLRESMSRTSTAAAVAEKTHDEKGPLRRDADRSESDEQAVNQQDSSDERAAQDEADVAVDIHSRAEQKGGSLGAASEKEELARRVMDLAVELELHARRLLVTHLPSGSKPQVVLQADRNVQLRAVQEMRRTSNGRNRNTEEIGASSDRGPDVDEPTFARWSDSEAGVSRQLNDDETMEEVRRYRESFAALLVAGSRLCGLEGDEKYLLERRMKAAKAEGQL